MPWKDNLIYAVGVTLVVVIVIATAYTIIENDKRKWHPSRPVSGTLVLLDSSDPTNGTVSIRINLTFPNSALINDIIINLGDDNDTHVSHNNYTSTWHSINNRTGIVENGDELTISMPSKDLHGYQVIVAVNGYSGTMWCPIRKN